MSQFVSRRQRAKRRQFAKLTRPQIKAAQKRVRLYKAFEDLEGGELLWVWSPAGSGKTTLVSTAIESLGGPCLWYLLDQGDSDLSSYYNRMALSVEELSEEDYEVISHLGASQTSNPEALARTFFQEAYAQLPQDSWVVFDDAQHFDTSETLQATLRGIAGSIPTHVKLIVVSRLPPPPFAARMEVSGRFSTISYDELRFTEEETRNLIAKVSDDTADADRLQTLHSVCQGWAAAIVLLSKTPTDKLTRRHNSGSTPLLDYLGEEFFKRLAPEEQTFLENTAVVEVLPPEVAVILSGRRDAEERLQTLCQNNFLVQYRPDTKTYQYHSLLREFVAEHRTTSHDAESNQRWIKSADALEQYGYVSDAASLLLMAEEPELLAELIKSHASAMITEGRWQSLRTLLDKYQEIGNSDNAPWIRYWLGVCQLNTDTAAARDSFVHTYKYFLSDPHTNKVGVYLSWARIVESFFLESGSFSELDYWIDEYRRIRQKLGFSLSKEVLGRVSLSLFNALVFLRPSDPQIPKLERRLRWLLRLAPSLDIRVMLAAYLMRYYIYKGDMASCQAIAERIEVQLESVRVSPLIQSAWLTIASTHAWISQSPEAGIKAAEQSLAMMDSSGIRVFEFTTLSQGMYSSIGLGDWQQANTYFEKAGKVVRHERRMDLGQYLYLAGWLALAKGDLVAGLGHMRESEAAARETGSPYVMARGANGLAQALLLGGDYEEASQYLDLATEHVSPGGFESIRYRIEMARAQLAYAQGRLEEGHKVLQIALTLGRLADFSRMPLWLPKNLSILSAHALEQDIESEYVRDMIRIQHLPIPPNASKKWPWPVHIHYDGGVTLWLSGTLFDTENAKVRRPMELLECLLFLGGTKISQESLCDRLWPDSDGDKASASLKVNLSRLRRLLPPNSIQLQHGQLSINREIVWLENKLKSATG